MTDTTRIVPAAAAWDDARTLVGKEFVSDWLAVDPERVKSFEWGSYVQDNPHGVNSALYPDGLIEGFHLLSLLDYLVNGVSYVDDPAWSGWNYGLNRARFVSPVTTSDRIRVRGSVASLAERGDDLLVTYDVVLEVEGRQKPGAVAEWLVLWTRVEPR